MLTQDAEFGETTPCKVGYRIGRCQGRFHHGGGARRRACRHCPRGGCRRRARLQNGLYFGRGCFSYEEVRSSLTLFSAGASARVACVVKKNGHVSGRCVFRVANCYPLIPIALRFPRQCVQSPDWSDFRDRWLRFTLRAFAPSLSGVDELARSQR